MVFMGWRRVRRVRREIRDDLSRPDIPEQTETAGGGEASREVCPDTPQSGFDDGLAMPVVGLLLFLQFDQFLQ